MKFAHAMPFGAELGAGGVRFSVWAPGARSALVHVDGRSLPMNSASDAEHFICTVPGARAGSRYAFSFDDSALRVPDPASRFNPEDVHAASEVIDARAYDWQTSGWRGRPWHEAVIYELHVGTFTRAGTYAAAAERLDYLVELGVTAIELMPLADTPGRWNWGYDGVLQFAPDSVYGRPEDLKRFIDAAHARGLMVLLDVVYNHFGPDGNYLHLYAPQFFTQRHHTPWGNGINFDDRSSAIVRNFFVHNALYWLEEYRFDGLRLDAVHAIADDSTPDFLTELATRVRAATADRHVHLVLENDDNTASYLERDEAGRPRLYTAQWNDDWHHTLHVLLTGERRGHYEDYEQPGEQLLRATVEGFAYQGEHSRYRGGRARGEPSTGLPPEAFVSFLQNHDQIGNRPDGKRLWQLVPPLPMVAAETLLLLLPSPLLIFMGDELHAASPFPFFCDFGPELAAAVTAGRRREFAKLARTPAELERMPGPNTAEAHAAAIVDWECSADVRHAAPLELYRRLLGVRRDVLVPLMPAGPGRGKLIAEHAFAAEWQLRGALLHLVANLASAPAPAPAARHGERLAATAELAADAVALPPWYVEWRLERL